ncbi:Holliday junction branch migration protein RuvA [Mobilibacterium timonense]|uniref:Holliday junction branch migration protein RuvA n=1 Tax=Mobilibacterium timonense TaxID=1871012 RepID=UPI002355EDF8|nr:Holliday junction branch migration protein RuvA [Mobilibacterium timonense]MBM6990911.1 Holliday junction branch migration protein RuvA [Mobilibacterium timonense]
MIRHITGEYLYYEKGAVVIQTAGGIGFRVFVTDLSPILNSREGDTVSVFTYMAVKEDSMSLYGFPDRDSLELFQQLLTVSGVGPKAAMAILSLGSANRVKSYIAAKDAKSLAKAQGVGKKSAERIILELSEKVSAVPEEDGGLQGVQGGDIPALTSERNEAVIALTTLGYTRKEAETAIASVPEEDLDAEEYIRRALKYLL